METCAAHGLKYDPTKHTSCVMCRRGTPDEAIDEGLRERRKAVRIAGIGAGAIALLATAGWLIVAKDRPAPAPTSAAAATTTAPEAQADPSSLALTAAAPVPRDRAAGTAAEHPALLPLASPEGHKPRLIPRMQLERAKERCGERGPGGGGDYACLIAITPFLDSVTQLPVSRNPGDRAVHAYTMNRTGLGFDCLWFSVPELAELTELAETQGKSKDRRAPKQAPYVALLVAAPKDRMPHVTLDRRDKPHRVEAMGAPWPADYAAFATVDSLAVPTKRGLRAQAKRYSACMTFPDDAPATVYAGVAAWIGTGPADKEDGGAQFRKKSVEALGLEGALASE